MRIREITEGDSEALAAAVALAERAASRTRAALRGDERCSWPKTVSLLCFPREAPLRYRNANLHSNRAHRTEGAMLV